MKNCDRWVILYSVIACVYLLVMCLGCAEYDTKAPIIQLTDCPLVLPDYVNGKYSLVKVETSNLVTENKRVFYQPEYIGSLSISDETKFCMLFKQQSWYGLESKAINGYAAPIGKGVIAIYETDKMRDILEVYQYSYLDKLLKLRVFFSDDRVRKVYTWKKIAR